MHIIDLFGMTLVIPVLVIIVAGMVKYNEKIKNRVMCILAFLYNFAIGLFNFFMFLASFYHPKFSKGLGYLISYLIFLIPINIFMKKKGKIRLGIYLTIIIIAMVLGYIVFNKLILKNIN